MYPASYTIDGDHPWHRAILVLYSGLDIGTRVGGPPARHRTVDTYCEFVISIVPEIFQPRIGQLRAL